MILVEPTRHLSTIVPGWHWFPGIISPDIKLFKAYGEGENLYMTKELEIEIYDY